MIVETAFLDKLKQFGLNSYQAKLWTALLSRGVATAGELSDISNVPRSRAYDVLESLEKKGFIIMKIGKPIKYIAVPPAEVVKRVQNRIKTDADKQTEQIESLKASEVMNELQLLHAQGIDKVDPTELTASIKGRNNIYEHLSDMLDRASKSVVIATTAQGLVRKADALKRNFKQLKKKGVKVKIAAPINNISKPVAKELAQFAEIRNSSGDARFVLIDGKELTFMLVDDKEVNASYDTGIKIQSDFFVKSFQDMFDVQWKGMKKA
jgi:sugar-specific transcriptional regulator TrmB